MFSGVYWNQPVCPSLCCPSCVVNFLPCVHSRGHIFMKLGQNVYLMISRTNMKMGKKLGQILEKPFVRSRGHIFSLIIMKLGQNVCLEIVDEFESGSYRVKN